MHYPLEVYDAGAQIILNSFDWLVPNDKNHSAVHEISRPGSIAHPFYGLLVIFLVLVCLFSVDVYVGLSWISCWLANSLELLPLVIYHEAYSVLHQRKGLPSLQGDASIFVRRTPKKRNGSGIGQKSSDDGEEVLHLMEGNHS